jgi:HAD superfamily hydrolase (TIGR01509 family)
MIKSIIFGLNGVLFDGEFHKTLFLEALNTILIQTDITPRFHDRYLNGMSTRQKLRLICQKFYIPMTSAEEIRILKQELTLARLKHACVPSAMQQEMMESLIGKGYKLFCVANSCRQTTEACLEGLGLLRFMTGILTNEDVVNPKPSPEPFLKLMELHGLNATECLILEDSTVGLVSAKESGAHVMPIGTPYDVCEETIMEEIEKIV